ncbi:MAG: STAS/SEC14 domain-containing protein, partial [Pirellulales bacterium]
MLPLIDQLERSLDEKEQTHLYVEVENFLGIEPAALPDYLPRAAAMLGKLRRFGRVAIVSDLRWIRWATKIESALLPHISYETFTSDERHRALAWVEGKLNPLHDPSIRIIETDQSDVLGFELNGRISAADAEFAADYFNKALAEDRPLRLLGRVKC